MPKSSSSPAESFQIQTRGSLHVGNDDGGHNSPPIEPHTAPGGDDEGKHSRVRVLALTVKLGDNDPLYQRLKDLSWQAARYRNLFLRAKWAEAKSLCVDPSKNIPHDVTKWIRSDEKMELSGAAYSAAEREVQGAWAKEGKRILAGGPLPEWKPTAALSVRGHKIRKESGVWITIDDDDHLTIHLAAQAATCEGGCWLKIPLHVGACKDWHMPILEGMATGKIPILKATVVVKPFFHKVIIRLTYGLDFTAPLHGNRTATLGPIIGDRLLLRTAFDTRDFSGRLHTILERKTSWDKIRRRVTAQIGRRKGHARTKRKVLSNLTWEDWLSTFLHTWSADIIGWLAGQGVSKLSVIGLEKADFAVFKFVQMLKYKGEDKGIVVSTEGDIAEAPTKRSVKQEIGKQRRKTTKRAKAIRELEHQVGV